MSNMEHIDICTLFLISIGTSKTK